ncbi:MAG TPA: hypothetical protein VFA89_22010 [Terriglobales bacterium]|nr:hypothetical protein [Terriglobales bacterium]
MSDAPNFDAPKLLVEWSSRWEEFVSSIRPALAHSDKRLAGEARTDLFPLRGMVTSWIVEIALLIAVVVLPAKLASMRPYTPPTPPKYDVIYFSGDELPRMEDNGGAESGRTGRGGGQEAHHRTQTIRVARENLLTEKIVDAPKLNLPRSRDAVANLLAVNRVPGPAPAEGLKSSIPAAAFPKLGAVAPAPDPIKTALPSPSLPSLNAVAPSPQVTRDRLRGAPALAAAVIPPIPSGLQHDLTATRPPSVGNVQVVPPPVSAPERETANLNPKLVLPTDNVVAPAPVHVTHELGTLGASGLAELGREAVPPPVQVGTPSLERRSVGALNGTNSVVPPPVQAGSGALGPARMSAGNFGNTAVVPPPVPVKMGSALGSGTGVAGLVGGKDVVPPPVQADTGLFSSLRSAVSGLLGGSDTSGAGGVVPPPPNVSGTGSPDGRGFGSKGGGLGGPMDVGSNVAPPSGGGGSASGNGLVVSTHPGSGVGNPGGGSGSLAMSPLGGDKPGQGGSGGGAGIGHGNGPGSWSSGEGPGAGQSGAGRGSQEIAKGGISPYPGTGGAGRGTRGTPPMPGVAVSGGSVNLPSFGSNGGDPSSMAHSSTGLDRHGLDITVVGTSRSGGAFAYYGALKGDKVYTIYIPTAAGTAVMQYADPTSASHPYAEDLVAPEAMRADFPAALSKSRLVISCVLDRSGLIRDVRFLEPPGDMANKVLASLSGWKFRPVLRNDQPVEVNAILGFNIDTR